MIDSFLKVIEKGIDLVNTRQKNNKDYFLLIVTPLFEEFEKVAADYFKLFDSRRIEVKDAVNIREGYLQARIKVTELARSYSAESKDKDLILFFDSVSNFFYGNLVAREISTRSDGWYFINILTEEKTFNEPQLLLEARDSLESRWETSVHMFAKLKIKYGSPIGFKV